MNENFDEFLIDAKLHIDTMRLFFYYPQDEYVAFLMGVDELDFVDEIDCVDLFAENDDRNRVLIFELP